MRKILLSIVLLLCAQVSFAQSWSWNDMIRWVKDTGKYKLAEMAHPYDYANEKVLSYSVSSSSSSITVTIKYQGFLGPYTDEYEVVRATYNGHDYFRRIRVEEPYDPVTYAFKGIDSFGVGYENAYLKAEISHLYGNERFNNLSRGEKAAFILMSYFLGDI